VMPSPPAPPAAPALGLSMTKQNLAANDATVVAVALGTLDPSLLCVAFNSCFVLSFNMLFVESFVLRMGISYPNIILFGVLEFGIFGWLLFFVHSSIVK
jgi:hypothetical protein